MRCPIALLNKMAMCFSFQKEFSFEDKEELVNSTKDIDANLLAVLPKGRYSLLFITWIFLKSLGIAIIDASPYLFLILFLSKAGVSF